MFEIISAIGNESKTNAKIDLLKSNFENEELKRLIEYTLNPNKMYGIIPDTSWIDVDGIDKINNNTYDILDQLYKREITGNHAKEVVKNHIDSLTKKDAELFIRIIRKDLRIGVGDSTVNKVWKGLLPEYPYMRCETYSKKTYLKWNSDFGFISQVKMDGIYNNANIIDGNVQFVTRQGNNIDMSYFDHIANELTHLSGYQIHGELVVYDKATNKPLPRKTSNGIINSVTQGGKFEDFHIAKYIVWDMIPINESKKGNIYNRTYKERFDSIIEYFKDTKNVLVVDYSIFYNIEDCFQHALELIKQGHEGTVIKNPNGFWRHGTSKDQVKIKVEVVSEFEIIGATYGKKDSKYENEYATLQCKSSDDLLQVNVAIKNDKMRKSINDDLDLWLNKIVSIKYNNIEIDHDSGQYSLYLPVLASDLYRTDKLKADDIQTILSNLQNPFKGTLE